MSRAPVVLRRMRLEDIPAVHALDTLSFTLPWSERSFRFEIAENPAAHAWVAEASAEIIGMLVAWLLVDEIHIATLAVHPDWRGAGVGSRLVAQALAELIPLGAKTALLEVRRSNLAAQRLYRRFGFEVVGVRKRYYQDNFEDALLMTLDDVTGVQLQQTLKQLMEEHA